MAAMWKLGWPLIIILLFVCSVSLTQVRGSSKWNTLSGVSSKINITVVNKCSFTVWPVFKDPRNKTIELELPKGSVKSVLIRKEMEFILFGKTNCQSGDGNVNKRPFWCQNVSEPTPTTSVSFKFRLNGSDEYYVDNVDGFNIAVSVDAIGGTGSAPYNCAKAGCIGQVKKEWCPRELRVIGGEGCQSACQAFKSPEYCCRGWFSTPATCQPTRYATDFQNVCPRSRTLPYNTDTNTKIFMCEGANYTVTFCPAARTFSTIELGGQLRSTDRLVSDNGEFTMGFFGENYGFLGIWYTHDEKKKVWVLDLAEPTASTGGNHALSINPNTGDLIVITTGGIILCTITNVKYGGPKQNLMAALENNGRLRLIINKNSTTVLWQSSFHRPIAGWVVVVVVVIVLGLLGSFLYIIKIKCGRDGNKTQDISMKDIILNASNLRLYNYKSILVATRFFSTENKLGQGGFGPVYKGTLDGEEVAVKKLKPTSEQGREEFETEISVIFNAKHASLVQIRGWCVHGEDLMLVYEFMQNRSLDYHIYDEARRMALDWPKRKSIIQTVASGLVYLHRDLIKQIIHRDLKPSNILLDQNMNPKISDFGLAKFGPNENGSMTQAAPGTERYMAPEYKLQGIFTTKSDLYAFGIVMLEIVTGLSAIHNSFPDNCVTIVGYAWHLWRQGEKWKLKDPLLTDENHIQDEVSRIVNIAFLCIQEKPEDRPQTSTICELLTNDMIVPEPNPPGWLESTSQTPPPSLLAIFDSTNTSIYELDDSS